jgi:isopentenyl phosphate kinase
VIYPSSSANNSPAIIVDDHHRTPAAGSTFSFAGHLASTSSASAVRARTIEDDRVPLLFVDVNIEEGKTARIVVYEGDKSEQLANKFAADHGDSLIFIYQIII